MIEIKKEDRKKYQYNMKKRENQKLFNILNYEKYNNLKYEKNDNLIKRYSKYDEELKNIEILENKEYNIYQLKLNDYIIYLRDKIELSFFFNKYFMIEYQEKWKDRGCDYKAVLVEGQIDGIAQIIPEKNNQELFENNIKS